MAFKNEAEFEKAVIEELFEHGWEKEVLRYKTEDDLIQNWADILFENNRQIDKLNEYADLTIYNFTQMTENIGRFTAAGVDLDTSVSAVQGISNLAAVSGSDAAQASTAMYNLSQALSSGTVRLMDWNSVVNAGMGGELFQKAILRNAKAMGKTVEVTVETVNKKGKKVKR